MDIHWLNSRGEDRSADSMAVFKWNERLYHVAICPDLQKPRVFLEIAVHHSQSIDVLDYRWCETID